MTRLWYNYFNTAVFQSNPITTSLGHQKLFVPTVAKVRPRQLPKGQVGTIMPLERWGTHQWFPSRKQQHTFGPLWGNSFMPNAWCELSSWTPNIYLSRSLNGDFQVKVNQLSKQATNICTAPEMLEHLEFLATTGHLFNQRQNSQRTPVGADKKGDLLWTPHVESLLDGKAWSPHCHL